MITETVLIGGGAAIAGLAVGAIASAVVTGRRMRARIEEVGEEVARLTRVTEDKLLDDDPNLPDLMRNLNTAVEQAYRAIDALETQSELTRRKTEGAKEVAASSRQVMRMMEDMGANVPHVPAPKVNSIAGANEPKAPPKLR